MSRFQISYTYHPFVDIGLGVIAAFAKKRKPDQIDLDDLESVAYYLKDIYSHIKPVQNFISVIFTNSHFAQPAKSVEERETYADQVLFAFRSDRLASEDDVCCTFFPELAAVTIAHRQHIPLLNGESISNFSPLGTRGIPVSGIALLAIHAMPLGCFKCGHLLAFHQLSAIDDPDAGSINLVLARKALDANRKAISMMLNDDSITMPSFGSYVKTRYVENVLWAKQQLRSRRNRLDNITGYYFTNYGPKPSLEIVRLDNATLDFINAAEQDHAQAWSRVKNSGWQMPKEAEQGDDNTETWRNEVYEALFGLPDKARKFIWYIARSRDWQLMELFLYKVMAMEQERIDSYRELGDRLAQYSVQFEGSPQGFYYGFSRATDYAKLRRVIRSASERMLKAKTDKPLFTYDEFILAFEHPSDTYSQWRLARDLISIRMLEILHKHNVDLSDLPDSTDEEEVEA